MICVFVWFSSSSDLTSICFPHPPNYLQIEYLSIMSWGLFLLHYSHWKPKVWLQSYPTARKAPKCEENHIHLCEIHLAVINLEKSNQSNSALPECIPVSFWLMKCIVILETEGNVSVLTEVFKCRYECFGKIEDGLYYDFFFLHKS